MLYPYMTLNDDTEITHSEMLPDGRVKVNIETPVENGFHHAVCYIPGYQWEDVEGYSEMEMMFLKRLVANNANVILEFSQNGGFARAESVSDQ